MTFDRSALKEAKRIVVKVGTSTITYANGKRNFEQIDRLARELADLQNQGKEMILVTSGAVAVGVDRLGLSEKPKNIPGKQAAAAVGQGILMHTYEKLFAEYGQIVAQVLLTKTESLDRHRYTNSRNTFMELLKNRVIPIVNENDVVALDELKIGDNDNMSALVAGIVDADLVVILSDVDGLYTANPQTHPDAKLVSIVSDITPEIEASAGGVGSSLGTGGMFTKIQAAKAATSSGIHLAIARGDEKYAIARILQGENIGTVFVSKENRLQFRKRWLAFGARIMGKLVIDEGCAKGGREDTGRDALEWIKWCVDNGAGEVCLNSIDTDGVRNGFDLEMLDAVAARVNVPIIASGGAGKKEDFLELFHHKGIDAGLAAGIFHQKLLTIRELKEYLNENGVEMRL